MWLRLKHLSSPAVVLAGRCRVWTENKPFLKFTGKALSNLCEGSRCNFHVTVILVTVVIYTFFLLEIVLRPEMERLENRLIV
jgi:hypothetical protein